MTATVFWAWQADHDPRCGRSLVKKAIEDALAIIAERPECDERPEIDHDTKGVPGLAAIAESIFNKISHASVFVGDLTPISSRSGKGRRKKWSANPNVLIELGYAKSAIGPDAIILVWNTAFPGTRPEELPFDLAHRRAPISYHAEPDCDAETLSAARERLTRDLCDAISGALRSRIPAASRTGSAWHREAKVDPALWFSPELRLRIVTGDDTEMWRIPTKPKSWVRILPASWPANLMAADLPTPFTLGHQSGDRRGRIPEASFTWRGNPNNKILQTGTAWFHGDGEIWSFDLSAFAGEAPHWRVHVEFLLERWLRFISASQKLIVAQGGKGPFLLQCGVTGLTNVRWDALDGVEGPRSAENTVSRTFTCDGQDELMNEMLVLFRALCDAFGKKGPSEDSYRQFALGQLLA